jgi:adenylyltransferase/sulfurtransferase
MEPQIPSFEDTRYNRQLMMPEWGAKRQDLLKSARVAVIGAGGVKSTLLMALVAGGVGNIRIIEFDHLELSNLNRQILYRTSGIGQSKGQLAIATLKDLNPEINLELIEDKISEYNISDLLNSWDFIVEGGDSPAGRNLVNDYCLQTKKPFVHTSAQYNYGYAFSVVPEWQTACFACYFPNDHTREINTGPVPVSVLATSIAGSLGAAEIFKWFLGYKNNLIINKKLCFSSLLLSGEFQYEETQCNPHCEVCSKYYTKKFEGG